MDSNKIPADIGLPADIGPYKFNDRVYRALAVCGSVDEANAFMAAFPGSALLAEADGKLVIASKDDMGEDYEYGRRNPNARRAYSVGVEGAAGPFSIRVHARDRSAAAALAKRHGYEVRDVNMIG